MGFDLEVHKMPEHYSLIITANLDPNPVLNPNLSLSLMGDPNK
jgi:hypothetical protein